MLVIKKYDKIKPAVKNSRNYEYVKDFSFFAEMRTSTEVRSIRPEVFWELVLLKV